LVFTELHEGQNVQELLQVQNFKSDAIFETELTPVASTGIGSNVLSARNSAFLPLSLLALACLFSLYCAILSTKPEEVGQQTAKHHG
jgi:hypothetical protein